RPDEEGRVGLELPRDGLEDDPPGDERDVDAHGRRRILPVSPPETGRGEERQGVAPARYAPEQSIEREDVEAQPEGQEPGEQQVEQHRVEQEGERQHAEGPPPEAVIVIRGDLKNLSEQPDGRSEEEG